MMEVAMRMPDLGTVDDTIKVVKWLVEVGQPIRRGQPLLEVETDKSIMELESAVTGTLAGDQRLRGRGGGGRPGYRDIRGRRRADQPEATARRRRETAAPAIAACAHGVSIENGSLPATRPARLVLREKPPGPAESSASVSRRRLLARVSHGSLPADGLDPRV